MPPQMKKSALAAKYGANLDAAVKGHANDETNYGFVKLPGGIARGIAQLDECKFDVYKTGAYVGEYYFRASGTVIEPKEVQIKNGQTMSVAGLATSIMIPICDTKNGKGEVTSQEQHIEAVLNELRKLGVETAGATVNNLEDLAAAAKDTAPYFYFSTTESGGGDTNPKTGKPYEPRVWENWNGTKGLENFVHNPEPSLDDGTGGVDPTMVDQADTPTLVKFADMEPAGPKTEWARAQLTAMAEHAGVTDADMGQCGSWGEVVDLINGATTEASEPAPGKNGFVVGGTAKYRPPTGPSKKPGKAVEVEITTYDAKKGVCGLTNLADRRTKYKDVKVEALEPST